MAQTHNNRLPNRYRRGFTLIEILIAVAVFTIGVLAVLWVISDSLQESRKQHMRQVATSLAQQKLEELRNVSYFDLVGGQEEDEYGAEVLLDEYGQPGGMFARTWVVAEDSPMQGTKTLEVTVSWQGETEESISIMTIVSRPFPEGMM